MKKRRTRMNLEEAVEKCSKKPSFLDVVDCGVKGM